MDLIQVGKDNSQPSGKVDATWRQYHLHHLGCCDFLVVSLPHHYSWIKHRHLIRRCKMRKSVCARVWRQNTLNLMFSLKSNQDQTGVNLAGSPTPFAFFAYRNPTVMVCFNKSNKVTSWSGEKSLFWTPHRFAISRLSLQAQCVSVVVHNPRSPSCTCILPSAVELDFIRLNTCGPSKHF